jgi:hypothetical protein
VSALSETAGRQETPANTVVRASRAPAAEGPKRRYCGAKRTRGEDRCTRPAGWGTDHPGYGSCKFHAGSTPNGRAAARVEMARDSLERLGVAATATPVNPVELLGDLIDQSAAIVAYLREQVAALPAVLTADGTHPLVRLYGQERDRAARVAREAVALGLEERRVRLDETTRDRLVRLFLAALAEPELGLSKEQIEAAPRVAARLFRAGVVAP